MNLWNNNAIYFRKINKKFSQRKFEKKGLKYNLIISYNKKFKQPI